LAELKPGTRVVAHDYYLDEWRPDRMVTLTVPEKKEANGTDKAYLYLWVVPAVVAGTWRIDLDAEERSEELIVAFSQRFQMIDAVAEKMRRPIPIRNPSLTGAEVKFSITLGTTPYQFSGRVDGDKIQGTATAAGGKGPLRWRGTRITKGGGARRQLLRGLSPRRTQTTRGRSAESAVQSWSGSRTPAGETPLGICFHRRTVNQFH
jgi:hypothetical protein